MVGRWGVSSVAHQTVFPSLSNLVVRCSGIWIRLALPCCVFGMRMCRYALGPSCGTFCRPLGGLRISLESFHRDLHKIICSLEV